MVLSPLKQGGYQDIAARLEYFLGLDVGSEFKATICRDGKVVEASDEQLAGECNQDTLDPKDGSLLKVSDSLAAYIEAPHRLEKRHFLGPAAIRPCTASGRNTTAGPWSRASRFPPFSPDFE